MKLGNREITVNRNLIERLVFLAIGVMAGIAITCLLQSRPEPSIYDVDIGYGMSMGQIKDLLGQPDNTTTVLPGEEASHIPIFEKGFDNDWPSVQRDIREWGPFGAYYVSGGRAGHMTRYRVRILFADDKVIDWTTQAPLNEPLHPPGP